MLQLLLANGASLLAHGNRKQTILHQALEYFNVISQQLSMDNKADFVKFILYFSIYRNLFSQLFYGLENETGHTADGLLHSLLLSVDPFTANALEQLATFIDEINSQDVKLTSHIKKIHEQITALRVRFIVNRLPEAKEDQQPREGKEQKKPALSGVSRKVESQSSSQVMPVVSSPVMPAIIPPSQLFRLAPETAGAKQVEHGATLHLDGP